MSVVRLTQTTSLQARNGQQAAAATAGPVCGRRPTQRQAQSTRKVEASIDPLSASLVGGVDEDSVDNGDGKDGISRPCRSRVRAVSSSSSSSSPSRRGCSGGIIAASLIVVVLLHLVDPIAARVVLNTDNQPRHASGTDRIRRQAPMGAPDDSSDVEIGGAAPVAAAAIAAAASNDQRNSDSLGQVAAAAGSHPSDQILARSVVMVEPSGPAQPVIHMVRVQARDERSLGDAVVVGYRGLTTIVRVSEPILVHVYGARLTQVTAVGLALSESRCNESLYQFDANNILSNLDYKIVFQTQLQEVDADFVLCMRLASVAPPGEWVPVTDDSTRISTRLPPRIYYLPFGIQVALIAFLLVLSGLFSGLNLGLMALTPHELMVIEKSGSKTERGYAEAILPVRRNGNLLLCSLLIGNVCVNSGISILLDDLTGSGALALLVSSAGIVVLGEIFPQSLCVKKGLAVGAHTIWVTRLFLMFTFPVAYPISKFLDWVLGDEVVAYDKKRITEMIKLQTLNEEGFAEEMKIAVGAMEISEKTVQDVMTKIDDVFMLPESTQLNTKTVAEILRSGYTRIPIYADGTDRNDVVSLLFVKDLALLDPDDGFTIKTVCAYHQHPLRFVLNSTPLRVMLDEFKKGDYHLAMVRRIVGDTEADPTCELVGVVTLEDIVEEILQAEILDETDAVIDNVHRTKRKNRQTRTLSSTLLDEADNGRLAVSVHLQLVCVQWLSANLRAFHPDLITLSVLERLVRQHVRKVEVSNVVDVSDPTAVIPRSAKLYTKDEASDRFILILEGRAIVTIGQDAMTFEAGPWHVLGRELLDRLVDSAANGLLALPSAAAQPAHARSGSGPGGVVHSSRSSLGGGSSTAGGGNARSGGAAFVPDFTAVIRESCTFLEISAHTYSLAYRSSLLARGWRDQPALCEQYNEDSRSEDGVLAICSLGRSSSRSLSHVSLANSHTVPLLSAAGASSSSPNHNHNHNHHHDSHDGHSPTTPLLSRHALIPLHPSSSSSIVH